MTPRRNPQQVDRGVAGGQLVRGRPHGVERGQVEPPHLRFGARCGRGDLDGGPPSRVEVAHGERAAPVRRLRPYSWARESGS